MNPKTLVTTALVAFSAMASAQQNPFFNYQKWTTPHGTYPFSEIRTEHYMLAFKEGMKRFALWLN